MIKSLDDAYKHMKERFCTKAYVNFDIFYGHFHLEDTEYGKITYNHQMCVFHGFIPEKHYRVNKYEYLENLFEKFQKELAKIGYELVEEGLIKNDGYSNIMLYAVKTDS